MTCAGSGGGGASDFDKLFATRFNELDSLISSSPSEVDFAEVYPPLKARAVSAGACGSCASLRMSPEEGQGQSFFQWIIFVLLVVGIVFLLVYIYRKLSNTRKSANLFGSMVLPSVGQGASAGPRGLSGEAGGLGASGSAPQVKVVEDPQLIVPATDARVQINMFFADWCGHCKKMKPEFLEAAQKHPDVDFVLVENTVLNKHPEKDAFGVTGFPHLAGFRGKTQLGTLVGHQPVAKLHEFINKLKAMGKK